jgi:hypothetical protein
MRAAAEAAPFVHPKLSAMAVVDSGDFASGLDAAITGTIRMKQIETTPAKAELPPAGPAPTPISAAMMRLRRGEHQGATEAHRQSVFVEHVSKSRPTAKGP